MSCRRSIPSRPSHRQIVSIRSHFFSHKLDSRAVILMRILPVTCILTLVSLIFIAVFHSTPASAQGGKPVLSVTATTSIAGPQPGVFTITRSGGDTSKPLSIPYNVGGTATRDTDYALSGTSGLDSPFAPGKIAQAFSLDGQGRFALFPNDPAQDPTAESTIDAWVFFNQTPDSAGHIMSIVTKSDFGRDLDLQAEPDNLFHFYVAFAGMNVASTTVIQSGRWYHVAATYKANTEIKMYVNGVLENTRAIGVARLANGNPVGIGESYFFRGRLFKGLIDEAHMFNRALSASEIQSIFAADSAGLCKPAPAANCVTPPSGLVGWWPGDGRTVDIENGNAGTMFGLSVTMGAGQSSLTVNINPTGSAGSGGKNVVFTVLPLPDVYDLNGQASSAMVTLSGQSNSNDFLLSSVEPNRGGDTGSITTTIFGQGILPGATVKLARTGQPDIPGSQAVVAADGFSVTTVFDLKGKTQGGYDVMVINPDGSSKVLANGFAVEPATPVNLFVRVIPRSVIRIGNEYPFYVQYGNRGNTDATNVPLFVSVPNFVSITPDTNLPFQVGPDGDRTLVTITLPKVRARSDRLAEFLTVKIKVADPSNFHRVFRMRGAIGHPFVISSPGVAGALSVTSDYADEVACSPAGCGSIRPYAEDQDDGGGDTDPRTPNDPNEKDGPGGVGTQGYITQQVTLPYTIYFENKDTAALPAQDVVITDQLDPGLVDLSTFSFGPITLGNRRVSPPQAQTQFLTQVDLRPEKPLVVRITGKLETATGLLTWRFNSLDPVTGGPPEDPQAGFLPPNKNSPEGQGSVLFTVKPKTNLATGSEVRNKARIVFDVNAPIDTNEHLNTIDKSPPTSQVAVLVATQPTHSFEVNWTGTDPGSGISSYTVFVSENGGPFTVWQLGTMATSAIFYGRANTTYRFYSTANDLVGNQEPAKTTAEATTLTPAGNPITDPRWFARQHYIDFLSREPDGPGLAFWTGEITECNDPAKRQPGESLPACIERKRANTSAAFFLSPEFQNTGSFVVRVYWGTLGKMPNTPKASCPSLPDGYSGQCRPLYSDYIADVSQITSGIVVNDQLDPNVINANKKAFVDRFVNTAAFKAKYDSLNNQQFVDTLFQTTGINASAADRAALVSGLNAQPATETRSSVVFKVVDGTTTLAGGALRFDTTYGKAFYDKEFDDAFVFMEYIGYLRRNPDQAGYEFWLGKLKLYGNWQDAQMVLAFISSPEYRARFGQP